MVLSCLSSFSRFKLSCTIFFLSLSLFGRHYLHINKNHLFATICSDINLVNDVKTYGMWKSMMFDMPFLYTQMEANLTHGLCTVYKYLDIVYMSASCVFWLDEPGYIHHEVYNHQCAFTSMLE